jgi:hypothetical protein
MKQAIIIFLLIINGIFIVLLSSAVLQKFQKPIKPTEIKPTPFTSTIISPTLSSPSPTSGKNNKKEFRNILFEYRDSRVSKVFLIGDFNSWKEEEFKKEKNHRWICIKKIQPGTYHYQYVLVFPNGKKQIIPDPNNRKMDPKKRSILTVFPKNE